MQEPSDRKELDPEFMEQPSTINFMNSLGLKYEDGEVKDAPRPKRTFECPDCGGHNATKRTAHEDTAMECLRTECPDCGFSKEAAQEIPKTGPEAIRHALQNLDIDQLEAEHRSIVKNGPKSKRGRSIKILNALEGMRRNDITPGDLMINKVPVIPAHFRPFNSAGDTFIPGDANELYRDLINLKNSHQEVERVLGPEGAQDSRMNVYDSVKAVYGFGDPVEPKSKQRGLSGFMQKIIGSNAKYSYNQRKLLSKPQDSVSRGTIIIDPELSLDEIGIPEESAWKMYGPHIQRRLVRSGMSPPDALKALVDRTETAQRAIDAEMKERPVIYSRSPAWHRYNAIAGRPKRSKSNAISLNSLVLEGLNADFNGDSINGCHSVTYRINGVIKTSSFFELAKTLTGLTVEAMIKEADSYTRIYELGPGLETLGFNGIQFDWQPVKQLTVHTSHGQCYELETHTHKKVTATEHHNFAILGDDLLLQTHKTEDLPSDAYIPAVYNWGPSEELELDIPVAGRVPLTVDLAWLMGFYAAEGSCGGGALTFCCIEPEYFEKVCRMLTELFSTDTKHQDTKLHKQCIVREYRKSIVEWFRLNCGKGYSEKLIPSFMFRATPEVKLAYFQGVLDGDGSVGPDGNGNYLVRVEMNNREFIESLSGLLASFGIRSYCPTTAKSEMLRVSASDFPKLLSWGFGRKYEKLKLAADRKSQHLEKHAHNREHHDIIPVTPKVLSMFRNASEKLKFGSKEVYREAKQWRSGKPGKKVRLSDYFKKRSTGRTSMYLSRKKSEDFIWTFGAVLQDSVLFHRWVALVRNTDVQWERIIRVDRDHRPEVTFDLSVPGGELFCVHGNLLTHNTMNTHVPTTKESVNEAYKKLLPSKMLFDIRNFDDVVPVPKHEMILGLSNAQSRPAENKHTFKTEREAMAAIESGAVSLSDEIDINDNQSS